MLAGQDLSTPNAVLAALAGLAVVMLFIFLISRFVRTAKSNLANGAPVTAAAPEVPTIEAPTMQTPTRVGVPLPDTLSQGSLTLIDTDEPTAAVIMAIVGDYSGVELNRLNFKSIKRIDDLP